MTSRLLLLTAAPLVLLSGSPAAAADPVPVTQGTFRVWSEAAPAVTYDTTAVPAGATARVAVGETATGTRVLLKVTGLVPGRSYGAHLHTSPCTENPADAGPHYQHRTDPKQPSVDPAYANPHNEVWLDFTADRTGTGRSSSMQKWHFERPAWSLVLHAEHTHTEPGAAGTAGARVACLTRVAEAPYGNGGGRG